MRRLLSGHTSLIALGSGEKANITEYLRELADLINKYSRTVRFEARASGGGVSNLGSVESGDADMGISHPDVAKEAFEGTGDFAGTPHNNLRHLTTVGIGAQLIYTLADSVITSLSDLRGKKINMMGGTGTNVIGRMMLRAADIDPDRDAYCERMPAGDSIGAMIEGKFDATFRFVFVPADYRKMFGTDRSLKFITVEQNLIDKIAGQHGPYYLGHSIEGSELGIDGNVFCLAMYSMLLIRKQVDPEAAYEVLKIFYEHSDELTGGFRGVKPKEGLLGLSIPFHPGAEKFYREKGLIN